MALGFAAACYIIAIVLTAFLVFFVIHHVSISKIWFLLYVLSNEFELDCILVCAGYAHIQDEVKVACTVLVPRLAISRAISVSENVVRATLSKESVQRIITFLFKDIHA
jgi:hypothetical protein